MENSIPKTRFDIKSNILTHLIDLILNYISVSKETEVIYKSTSSQKQIPSWEIERKISWEIERNTKSSSEINIQKHPSTENNQLLK